MKTLPAPTIRDLLAYTLDSAHENLNRGDLSGALQSLNRAATLHPRDSLIFSQRGILHLVLGNSEMARTDFMAALKMDSNNDIASAGLARYYWNRGLRIEAEGFARRALAIDSTNEDALEVLSALRPAPTGSGKSVATSPTIANRSNNNPVGYETVTATGITAQPFVLNAPSATVSHAEVETAVPATVRVAINPSFTDLQEFYANATLEFGEVEPPQLNELHLQHSRVLPSREHILPLMPKGGVCAEVGTQTGDFAKLIFSVLQPAKLHIFDMDFSVFDHAGFQPAVQQGTVELHDGDSSSLLATMPEASFDFIYIDGDHSYEGAVRDLEQAARKVKPGGWIVCNDYTMYSPLEKSKYGVYRAVNEFCWKHGYEIAYLGLHQWSYHDVALRKMQPVDAAVLLAKFKPACKARATVAAIPAVAKPVENHLGNIETTDVIQTIGQGDEMFTGDKGHYFGVGKSALHCIESALLAANKPRSSVQNILDLPCGHGRVMWFFKAAFSEAQITACDLNKPAVDFCAKTFAAQPVYSNADVNQIPLQGKYDLIWSGSLLTHLRPEACAEFVRLWNTLINPGGLIAFTLHGRWVERSLATSRYKYGLKDADVTALLKEYYQTGFGYADYPGASGYGISVSSPAYVLSQLIALPDLKLISYHEKGWDNHQDFVCLQKQTPAELLG